jgi:cyclophilin family peptidyl-prolyl cis-trans isomerase
MKTLMHAALSLLLILPLTNVNAASPKVRMDTSEGTVVIELNAEKAPTTVANFLRYVQDGKYDGTIFHRVIKGFMNQGGGFTAQYTKVDTYEPIINEADNGLKNKRGTIAMARTGDPNSATNQFFINTVDNAFLDHSAKTQRGWGYCVFGEVVEGMDVMDRIAQVKTGAGGPFGQDVPKTPVVIKKVSLISETEQPQE